MRPETRWLLDLLRPVSQRRHLVNFPTPVTRLTGSGSARPWAAYRRARRNEEHDQLRHRQCLAGFRRERLGQRIMTTTSAFTWDTVGNGLT